MHIILITSRSDDPEGTRALRDGADDVLDADWSDELISARIASAYRIISARQELSAIYHTAPLAMLVFDRDGKLSRINPAGSFLSGSSTEQAAALSCLNALTNPQGCGAGDRCRKCDLRSMVRDTMHTRKRHVRKEVSIPSMEGDGPAQMFLASSAPLHGGDGLAILVCLEDISTQKQTELRLRNSQAELLRAREELRRLNHDLEDKVQQRTSEVRELLQQKDRFVSQLGHDLKTPLTPLVGLLPLLERMISDERAQRMITVLQDNVTYMNHLVEQTLDLARMNTGGLGLQWDEVDLMTLTRNVVASVTSLFTRKDIRVVNQIDSPVHVWADPMRLREVLANLLDNAIKYTEGPGSIHIRARLCGVQVELSIQDSGIGMTPEQAESAFDEFFKADPSRHDRGSSGLGLTICRRIVEAHGGSIHLTSDGPDQGTTALLLLPSCDGSRSDLSSTD